MLVRINERSWCGVEGGLRKGALLHTCAHSGLRVRLLISVLAHIIMLALGRWKRVWGRLRPSIAEGGERRIPVIAKGNWRPPRRTLDAVFVVHADERVQSSPTTNLDFSGLPVLNDEKALLTVSIEKLTCAYVLLF